MTNWFVNMGDTVLSTVSSVIAELESITEDRKTVNYWLDDTHNIFAFVNDNGGDDSWIEIHYELYNKEQEIIGDLLVLDTEDVNHKELYDVVLEIVNHYYGIEKTA